jgi:hypothetical protein
MSMTRMVLLSSLVFGLAWAGSARADEKPADKGKPEPKPIVIQLDASKLPPDVLKRLLELAPSGKSEAKPEAPKGPPKPPPGLAKKPGKKPDAAAPRMITLAEAIALAEKSSQGTAVKAERKGEGSDVHFKIDLLGKDGQKHKVELDAAGKPRPGEPEKKPDEKKKDD